MRFRRLLIKRTSHTKTLCLCVSYFFSHEATKSRRYYFRVIRVFSGLKWMRLTAKNDGLFGVTKKVKGLYMEAVRKVIKPSNKEYSVQLPGWAVGREIELIILPVCSNDNQHEKTRKRFHGLFDNPVEVKQYYKVDRDVLHER